MFCFKTPVQEDSSILDSLLRLLEEKRETGESVFLSAQNFVFTVRTCNVRKIKKSTSKEPFAGSAISGDARIYDQLNTAIKIRLT